MGVVLRGVFTVLVIVVLASCLSLVREVYPLSGREDANRSASSDPERYQQLVSRGEWLEAYTLLMGMEEGEWVEEQRQRVFAGMQEHYRSMGADWRGWLRWHQSLWRAGLLPSSLHYWQGLFDYYKKREQIGAALAVVQQARIMEPDLQLAPEMEELAAQQWKQQASAEDALMATVLVEVDQGLDTQGGVGVPKGEVGSGFFVDKSGYLLTNHHVISSLVDPEYEGYAKAYIRLPWQDGRVPVQVVGWDKERDLALLKAAVRPPVVLPIGMDPLKNGQTVFAVGSPAGLANSITRGAVSSLSRQILPLTDVLQIDTPLSPGNSGGPLINEKNEVVGVVFLKVAAEGFEGLGFAIPSQIVLASLPGLYAGGEAVHSWLGVMVDESKGGHIDVRYVVPGSPADRSGVREGDRLLAFNGRTVTSIADVLLRLPFGAQGSIFSVKLERDHQPKVLYGLLSRRWDQPVEKMIERDSSANLFFAFFGARLELIAAPKKFRVTEVLADSTADNYGLDKGDVLTLQWLILEDQQQLLVLATTVSRKSGHVPTRLLLAHQLDAYKIL